MTLLAVPIHFGVRALGETADVIVGDKGGADAPCAAQGIPEIAGVDVKAGGVGRA